MFSIIASCHTYIIPGLNLSIVRYVTRHILLFAYSVVTEFPYAIYFQLIAYVIANGSNVLLVHYITGFPFTKGFSLNRTL